jgi:hypothetical protein
MPFEKDGTGRNISPSQLHLPEACNEPRYTGAIVSWDIMKDVDLSKSQNFPGLGTRDLLPKTGTVYQADAPPPPKGGWAPPPTQHEYFAIGKRADGMPVDVIEYGHDASGKTIYKQQYLFQYDKLQSGETRVTVQNWMNSGLSSSSADGMHLQLGKEDNVLRGISQYYYSGGNITKSEYWTPRSLSASVPRDQRTPDLRIQYEGAGSIVMQQKSPSGLLSGGIRESGQMASNDLMNVAPKLAFYDLFAPQVKR